MHKLHVLIPYLHIKYFLATFFSGCLLRPLVGEGEDSPTNDAIRERMGGGSLSHISPVMRQWRESRKEQVSAALELPADLKKIIETSLGQVWTTANKLASVAIDSVRQEADKNIGEATHERDEALTEITRLEAQVASLEKQLTDKDKDIQAGHGLVEKARNQGAQLTTENAALTVRLEERDGQIGELKTALKEAANDNKNLQAELVEIAKKTVNQSPKPAP